MLKKCGMRKTALPRVVSIILLAFLTVGLPEAFALTANDIAGAWLARGNGIELYVQFHPNGALYYRFTGNNQVEEVQGTYRVNGSQLQVFPQNGQPYVMNIGMNQNGNLSISDAENYYQLVRVNAQQGQQNQQTNQQGQQPNWQNQQNQQPYNQTPQNRIGNQNPQQGQQPNWQNQQNQQPYNQTPQNRIGNQNPQQGQQPNWQNQQNQQPYNQTPQNRINNQNPQQGQYPNQQGQGNAGRAGYTIFTPYTCYDQQGLKDPSGRPMKVFDMLVPKGWKVDAKVIWKNTQKRPTELTRTDLMQPVDFQFKMYSPDMSQGLVFMPEVWFADVSKAPAAAHFPPGSNYGGFVSMPVMDPISYIKKIIIPHQVQIQNYQLVQETELPALAQSKDRELQIMNSALQMASMQVQHRAAMVRIRYMQNNVPMEGVIVSVVRYMFLPGMNLWMSTGSFGIWAPQQRLKECQGPLLTSLQSFHLNPTWAMTCMLIAANNHRGIAQVDAIAAKIDADIWTNRAKTNNQIHRDMYPLLAPFAEKRGPDGKTRFLPTDQEHQVDANGNIRSGTDLPDDPGWSNMETVT